MIATDALIIIALYLVIVTPLAIFLGHFIRAGRGEE